MPSTRFRDAWTDGRSDRIDLVGWFTIYCNRKAKPHKHLKKPTSNFSTTEIPNAQTEPHRDYMYSHSNPKTSGSVVGHTYGWTDWVTPVYPPPPPPTSLERDLGFGLKNIRPLTRNKISSHRYYV